MHFSWTKCISCCFSLLQSIEFIRDATDAKKVDLLPPDGKKVAIMFLATLNYKVVISWNRTWTPGTHQPVGGTLKESFQNPTCLWSGSYLKKEKPWMFSFRNTEENFLVFSPAELKLSHLLHLLGRFATTAREVGHVKTSCKEPLATFDSNSTAARFTAAIMPKN